MKNIVTILFLCSFLNGYSQKIESFSFNLYTDSLKKGVYNYINVDAKLTNGHYLPLTSNEIHLTSSYGKWDGNNLILDRDTKVDSVTIQATLVHNPAMKKTIVIYLKKAETEPELKTEKELLDEWKRKSKIKSKKNLA